MPQNAMRFSRVMGRVDEVVAERALHVLIDPRGGGGRAEVHHRPREHGVEGVHAHQPATPDVRTRLVRPDQLGALLQRHVLLQLCKR